MGSIIGGIILVVTLSKTHLDWYIIAIFIGITLAVRYGIYYGLEFALMFVFPIQNRVIRSSEGMSEISTAGLISLSFALGTRNMDIIALISAYTCFQLVVSLTFASYLAQKGSLTLADETNFDISLTRKNSAEMYADMMKEPENHNFIQKIKLRILDFHMDFMKPLLIR